MSRQSIFTASFMALGATLGVLGLVVILFFPRHLWPGDQRETQLEEIKEEMSTLTDDLNMRLTMIEQSLKHLSSRKVSTDSSGGPRLEADTRGDAILVALEEKIVNLEDRLEKHEQKLEAQEDITEIFRSGEPRDGDENAPPLHVAVKRKDENAIRSLLADGADVNVPYDGWTPIRHAVVGDSRELATLLISQGADVNSEDPDGDTALGDAALFDNAIMAQLLLEQGGARIEAKNKQGFSPLYRAARHGQRSAAELLLQYGAAVDSEDNEGKTPLFAASECGRKELVRLLLEWGANVNVEDGNGKNALSIAVESGHTEVAELLRQHGGR